MGKKAAYKKIRRLASQMPEINVKVVKGERVAGTQVISEGIKEIEGKPVSSVLDYRRKTIVEQPLNHNRKMKKLYNKFGVDGVRFYVGAVRHLLIQQQKTS